MLSPEADKDKPLFCNPEIDRECFVSVFWDALLACGMVHAGLLISQLLNVESKRL